MMTTADEIGRLANAEIRDLVTRISCGSLPEPEGQYVLDSAYGDPNRSEISGFGCLKGSSTAHRVGARIKPINLVLFLRDASEKHFEVCVCATQFSSLGNTNGPKHSLRKPRVNPPVATLQIAHASWVALTFELPRFV